MILQKKKDRRILHGIIFLIFVMLPLLLLPGRLANLKFWRLLREQRLEECVSFWYGGNRQIFCYTPGKDGGNTDAMGYVFLPSFADPGNLMAETCASRAEFVYGEQVISVSNGEACRCCFEEQVPYTVHFYDYRGKETGTKQITFLKSENLPVLYINTKTDSMERLDTDKTYKESASAELIGADGSILYQNELKHISGRGNHTFQFEKKSYQIKLEEPEDLLGMGLSDTWILLCNVYDPSYIRNKLTYDMALAAGMPGSPESEYIDVYFNGVYNGMYLLCEKVQIGENRLELADLEQQNRILNGEELDKAYRFLSEDERRKGTALLYNPEDITGGYLIEHDYGPKYQEVLSGFITEGGEHFAIKSPQHASQEEVAYIADRMQAIERAIMSEDGHDPVTGEHFSKYLDLESWADKYIVEEITRNNGGGLTSSYFYKPQDSVSTRVFGGPVWDYDKAYARVLGSDANTRNLGFLMQHLGENTHWFSYLYQHEEFVQMVKKEYREKFSRLLLDMSKKRVQEYLDWIEASAVLDRARFAHVYQAYEGETDYRAEAERVTGFILARKQFLDEVWLEDAPICQIHFLNDQGEEWHRYGVIAGERIGELPWEEDLNGLSFSHWEIEGTDTPCTGWTPVTGDMTLVGVWE